MAECRSSLYSVCAFMMKPRYLLLIFSYAGFFTAAARADLDRFPVSADLLRNERVEIQLVVRVTVPDAHMLYADQFHVEVPGRIKILPLSLPVPQNKRDAISGEEKFFYDQPFSAVYLVKDLTNETLNVTIRYQGCDQKTCFLPVEREFQVALPGQSRPFGYLPDISAPDDDLSGQAEWPADIRSNYTVAAVQTGYMDAPGFLSFLDASFKSGAQISSVQKTWQMGKLWLSVFLMILGGLALNLTPCVLPLVPVNLAIIGAGVRAASAGRGLLLGGLYGLGIILAYGGLGLVTVLTGAQFGAINALPWFNIGVAVLFLMLGLALLDVFAVDFSRFQGRMQFEGRGLGFIVILGAVSALLAGACVAPVVIAVLLLSSDLYLKGQIIGLVLPFLLGAGMALPWPFAGAGLSFLPKPGRWMLHVKHVFAAVIILAAFYYGVIGARMLYNRYKSDEGNAHASQTDGNWLVFPNGFPAGEGAKPGAPLVEPGQARGKPILIYFWASWCKSCHAMKSTTFNDPLVMKKMDDFVCIKFQAENPRDPQTAAVLREFGMVGLPTFVILKPNHRQ